MISELFEMCMAQQALDTCRRYNKTCFTYFTSNRLTNKDGISINYTQCENKLITGVYTITFNVKDYYNRQNRTTFYPYIDVSFNKFSSLILSDVMVFET